MKSPKKLQLNWTHIYIELEIQQYTMPQVNMHVDNEGDACTWIGVFYKPNMKTSGEKPNVCCNTPPWIFTTCILIS